MKIICIKAPKFVKNIFNLINKKDNKKTVEKKLVK